MKKQTVILALILGISLARCTGELPISDLINNTVTLKVLGTYESNTPYDLFSTMPVDDVFAAGGITNASPTLNNTTDIWKYVKTAGTGLENNPSRVKYYIDIAEIRIAEGQGKSSSQTIADYWSQFAISRQLMCTDYGTADGRTLANCADSNGAQRLTDFFNGGFTYPAVDIKSGNFNHMGIYFRRFATFPSATFNTLGLFSDGVTLAQGTQTQAESLFPTTFDNRTIYGADIEAFLQNKYGETATEPIMFPLQRKDLSLSISNDHEPYVMEIRIFLRNLMMVHLTQNPSSSTGYVYVAPADWNADHAYRDIDNAGKQGGSVLMAARVYQPSKVGSISMSTSLASKDYFAVVPTGTAFATPVTVLPLAATSGTNTSITNLPPGRYDVYRTCDVTKCSNSSTAGTCSVTSGTVGTPARDGYPETVVFCDTVTVTSNTATPGTSVACAASAACP